ncbi:Uncharacterized protein TCM_027567 [Theobroma cacao]|uniref:Integrase catalytic domain-containing protein n=1 Tax=Theobroma cacao TaxID=3641 RepID=A0A061GAM1_THECC|nr:Uncharacterized protein TCM_027567 [Theobroma cacao]
MDKLGYYFGIGNGKVYLFLNSKAIGEFKLVDNLYRCIRGKMTKTNKKRATHSNDLLEIMHTNISGPLIPTLCGNKYFVTFINYLSCFGYLYLIDEKSDAYEKFKIFKIEVEKQLKKAIKIVRSNQRGEYYGKYGTIGQHMGLFTKYLQECGIVAQYTMLGSLEQNVVSEIRNCNFKEMMKSMISYLNHSKGYRFFCPTCGTKVIESQVAKFLELNVANKDMTEVVDCSEPIRHVIIHLPASEGSVVPIAIERDDAREYDVSSPPQDFVLALIDVHPIQENEVKVPLRRSSRQRKLAISNDYMVFLRESDYDISHVEDLVTFNYTINCTQSAIWMDAIKD